MQIIPPFGYGDITPLTQDLRIRATPTPPLPEFTKHSNSFPVVASEMALACHDYPIVFVSHKDDTQFAMVAIVGIGDRENLFITEDNVWKAGCYVPAYVRRYPFCMTRVTMQGVAQPQRLICVEKDWIDPQGTAFFDEAGQPHGGWKNTLEFINAYEKDTEATTYFCNVLRDFKLLEPMTLQATVHGQNMALSGMYRISMSRMNTLNSAELRTLFKNGTLAGIYHHLSSINRFQRLLDLKANLSGTALFAPQGEPTAGLANA